jgi:NADPH-dependent 2,4-dienoyl-CoA reductase/sulfur reductase-like enzyme
VLKDARTYDDRQIVYLPDTRVDAVDAGRRVVRAGSQQLSYDALLLATGSRPRQLPPEVDHGAGINVRSLTDARRLDAALRPGARVAVIGGGFIGLEVAAAACSRGCAVTVIEAQPRVMSRGMPAPVSAFMQALHESHGVEIRCNETVLAIDWRGDGSGCVIRLADGFLNADVVVYGLGIQPNVELATDTGLKVADGIVVDDGCRTADPAIFAAGEVTSHPSGPLRQRRRIESWRVASEQPLVAAANMLGDAASYNDAPWLWSDQFDVNLQVLGDVLGGAMFLTHGDMASPKWTLIALDEEGLPIGAAAVNNGRDISMLRRAINARAGVPTALANDCRPLAGRTDAGRERVAPRA